MKAVGAVAALAVAAVSLWCGEAVAYRPFDGTDAAVADTGDVEIELGPVEYLREGAAHMLFAPDLRVNYGFVSGWEASLEGDVSHGLTAGIPGASLIESEALLKGVLREGSLQEKPGPTRRNSVFYCRGSMINMGPGQSSPVLSRSAGTGERPTSMLKSS
jgi:hypothetical protein